MQSTWASCQIIFSLSSTFLCAWDWDPLPRTEDGNAKILLTAPRVTSQWSFLNDWSRAFLKWTDLPYLFCYSVSKAFATRKWILFSSTPRVGLSFSTAPRHALRNPRHTVHQSPLTTPTLQCIWKSTKPAWKKTRFSFTVYSQLAWKTSWLLYYFEKRIDLS